MPFWKIAKQAAGWIPVLTLLFSGLAAGQSSFGGVRAANVESVSRSYPLKIIPAAVTLKNGSLLLKSSSGSLLAGLPNLAASLHRQSDGVFQLKASILLGGSARDSAYAVAVDSSGAIYVAGETNSPDFPRQAGFGNPQPQQSDGFIVKLAPGGASIEYAALLGGGGPDSILGLAVENGIAYLTGETWSRTFPEGMTPAGESDVWAAAVTPDGSGLIYSVRFGGRDQDTPNALTVKEGKVILTGTTWSDNFPSAGFHGEADAFLVRLGPTGSIEKAALFGGSGVDAAFDVAESGGQIALCGQTWSRNFPIRGFTGEDDGFVLLLNEDWDIAGGALLGGSSEDSVNACQFAVDGSVIAAGRTASTEFPLSGGSLSGSEDAFIARFSPAGTLQTAVRFGGSGMDSIQDLAASEDGAVWVTGSTTSADLPVVPDAFQAGLAGEADAFLAGFSSADLVSGATFTSYLGGSDTDAAQSLALGPQEWVVLTGYTRSANMPVYNSGFSKTLTGDQDAFIAWWGPGGANPVQPTPTLQSVVPTGTPAPTLSEQELSAAETASGAAQTAPIQTLTLAITSTGAVLKTPTQPLPQLTETREPTRGTEAAGSDPSFTAILATPPAQPAVGSPTRGIGWVVGFGIVLLAGVAFFIFKRRRPR